MKVFGVFGGLVVILLCQDVVLGQTTPSSINAGFPCRENAECHVNDIESDAFCVGGVCKCRHGASIVNCTISKLALSESRPSISLIGRSCKLDQDCRKLTNGRCNTTNNQCNCNHNFTSSSDNNSCLPLVTLVGGKCEDVRQCLALPNSTCSQSQCICLPGFHNHADRCMNSIGFGEKCENTEECSHVMSALCNEEKICACPATMYRSADGKSCVPSARQLEGMECNSPQDCAERLEHSTCINKRCHCVAAAHYVATEDKCIIHKGLNESCAEDYECIYAESGMIDHVKCEGRMCKCMAGFIEKDNKCINTGTINRISAGLMMIIVAYFVIGSTLE